jgi:putative hydrolase
MGQPGVNLLLDVDREYREKARAGLLPRIAPRRFNPDGRAWLPVLHTRFGPWHFTALFSNTERAHELHRTYDWVVVYYSEPGDEEGQATIVTERRGALAGERVVRGREPECARYYRSAAALAVEERA